MYRGYSGGVVGVCRGCVGASVQGYCIGCVDDVQRLQTEFRGDTQTWTSSTQLSVCMDFREVRSPRESYDTKNSDRTGF